MFPEPILLHLSLTIHIIDIISKKILLIILIYKKTKQKAAGMGSVTQCEFYFKIQDMLKISFSIQLNIESTRFSANSALLALVSLAEKFSAA